MTTTFNSRPFRIVSSLAAVVGLCASLARADAPVGHYTIGTDIVTDNRTGLVWQRTVDSSRSFSAAQTYCQTLPLAGGGWRLPTLKEALTLVDESLESPSMDPTAFPGALDSVYWTSSFQANDSTIRWRLDTTYGETNGSASANAYVRCVR